MNQVYKFFVYENSVKSEMNWKFKAQSNLIPGFFELLHNGNLQILYKNLPIFNVEAG